MGVWGSGGRSKSMRLHPQVPLAPLAQGGYALPECRKPNWWEMEGPNKDSARVKVSQTLTLNPEGPPLRFLGGPPHPTPREIQQWCLFLWKRYKGC